MARMLLVILIGERAAVFTLAGAGGGTGGGIADGVGSNANFNIPHGVAVDANGHILVADTNNRRIRIMKPVAGMFLPA